MVEFAGRHRGDGDVYRGVGGYRNEAPTWNPNSSQETPAQLWEGAGSVRQSDRRVSSCSRPLGKRALSSGRCEPEQGRAAVRGSSWRVRDKCSHLWNTWTVQKPQSSPVEFLSSRWWKASCVCKVSSGARAGHLLITRATGRPELHHHVNVTASVRTRSRAPRNGAGPGAALRTHGHRGVGRVDAQRPGLARPGPHGRTPGSARAPRPRAAALRSAGSVRSRRG